MIIILHGNGVFIVYKLLYKYIYMLYRAQMMINDSVNIIIVLIEKLLIVAPNCDK